MQRKEVFEVEYAGHPLRYSLKHIEARYCFANYMRAVFDVPYDICTTKELMDSVRKFMPPDATEGFVEYRSLIIPTALELLRWDCCIFHSAAFIYQDYAWLLTAPSGTGKTTQFLNWQRTHPGEVEMICGDMPVLEPRDDGTIWVHSTSWCGKENLGKKGLCAPLAGVVLLEQGKENNLTPLPPRDALYPFFRQFMIRPETEEQILALTRLMDRLLSTVPLWKFVNLGNDASTEMIRDTFNKRMQKLIGGNNAL